MSYLFKIISVSFKLPFQLLCSLYILSRFICLGLKRENDQEVVTPKHIKSKSQSSGTYSIFPSKPFSVCSEKVGHFSFTYAIFRHVFAQMGAFINTNSVLATILSCLIWVILQYKVFYTYIGQTLKKPPDPRRKLGKGLVKGTFKVFMILSNIHLRILLLDAAMHYDYSQCLDLLYREEEEAMRFNARNLDPLLFSNEAFLKFGMLEDPVCCVSIPGVNTENIKQVTCFSDHLEQVMLDTGATRAVTFEKKDFVSYNRKDESKVLKGIAKGLNIVGEGVIQYQFQADDGSDIVLNIKAYHVPDMPMRLISPQDMRTIKGNPLKFSTLTPHRGRQGFARLEVKPDQLNWDDMPPIQTKKVNLSSRDNLPWLQVRTPQSMEETISCFAATVDLTSEKNKNLSPAQKELMVWHQRLGHASFSQIQWLARSGKLPIKNAKAVGNCTIPMCASCQFAKQRRRPTKATKKTNKSDKEMEIKKDDLFPGQRISADHYQSAVPGRTYSSRGSYHPENMFNGGTIFVDHASGKIFLHHQESLSASESIKSMLKLEREAAESGVRIQSLHTDNGTFSSTEFMAYLASKRQAVTFSGVGAAHQNAVAERAIQTITYMARTMLIHAAMRSPSDTITANHWPMAMDYAAWVYNNLPKQDTGLSPNDLWSRSKYTPIQETLARSHVWGAPTYVLEPKLQKSGIKIPKWAPRSRRGVFMGFSPRHSTLVTLILNLRTHSITPQYHVVFDDSFSSVHSSPQLAPKIWEELITSPGARFEVKLDDQDEAELADEWLSEGEALARSNARREQILKTSLSPNLEESSPS